MDKRAVYISKTADEKDFTEIACDCHIHNGKLRYKSDRDRGHEILGEVTGETESGFTFRSDDFAPGEWAFKILTIQDFRRKYYKVVCEGETIAHVIKTTADLHEWFRKEFKI